ncbi:MAG TPA: putative aminohydrolase SsnA [Candidatus Limnocylindrales bacterium]|nr:putative aminohydrolase SsnA [Candidatus Limnocylindrales bacterium]
MLLLGNGTLLTLGNDCQVISDGALLIEDNTITAVGKTDELHASFPRAKFIDCRNKLVMPGFTCAHTHTYSTFARGMSLKDEPPADFPQILKRLWWRLDKALTLEDVYYSALIPLIECIKNGTTSVLDHHASPNAIEGSLEQIASAAQKTGIRVNLCYEVTDRDGARRTAEGIDENVNFIKKCKIKNPSMITASFGMHASFTIGENTMEKCARLAHDLGTGVHIHVAESAADLADSREKYGMGVVERLNNYGLLGPSTLAAHCVHISEQEMELLAQTKTNVAHNPQSNMNNAVGCAAVKKMLDAGVVLGMGTDGMTTDMIEGMKFAHVLHKFYQNDPRVGWAEVPLMQFTNNTRIMTNYFPVKLGELTPGAAADVIVVNYDPPTPFTAENYYGHMVFGMTGRMVETTIVAGKILMQNNKIMVIDEEEINARTRELSAKLWERF